MHEEDHECKSDVLREVHLANLDVLRERGSARDRSWCVHTERFVETIPRKVEIFNHFSRESFHEIGLFCLEQDGLSFIKKTPFHVRFFNKMLDYVGGRNLDRFHAGNEHDQNVVNEPACVVRQVKLVIAQKVKEVLLISTSVALTLSSLSFVNELLNMSAESPRVLDESSFASGYTHLIECRNCHC